MRNKLTNTMKLLRLLALVAISVSLTISCSNKRKSASAGNNPYASNPYYTGDSSSSASSAGSAQYPTYDDSYSSNGGDQYPTYTDETPSYSDSGNSYPSYSGGSANPYPDTYSGGGASGGSSHTVAKGENLYRISLKYGTSVSAIQNANGLTSATIFPGQVLQIP